MGMNVVIIDGHDGTGGSYTSKPLDISGRKFSTLILPSIHILFSSLVAKKIYKETLRAMFTLLLTEGKWSFPDFVNFREPALKRKPMF